MTRIQIRRDTSSNWATYNPILADGEFALETDTRKLKIGNGEQPYNDLAYQDGGEIPDNVVTTDTTQTITGTKEFTNTILTVGEGMVRAQQSTEYRNGAGLSMGANDVYTDGGPFCPIWVMYNTNGDIDSTSNILTTYTQTILSNKNFNNANQLVRLDSSGKLPAIDGSQLTNLPAGNPSDAYSVTTINSNQDLNLLTTEGLYFVDTATNLPSGVSSTRGFVRVEKLNYPGWGAIDGSLVQTFTTINSLSSSTPPDIYARFRTTASFSPWIKVNGGEAPANMVTADTDQTITGTKTFNKIVLPDDSFDKGIYIGDNANPSIFAFGNSLSISDLSNLSIKNSLIMDGASPSLNLGDYTNDANFVINLCGYDSNSTKLYPIIQVNNNTKKIAIGNDTFSITDHNGDNIVTTNNIPTGALKYWTGTEADYTALESKDADTLYRTTDTNKVYLGTIQLSN